MDALACRYSPPEYELFGEFALFEGARRLDALAMSPWAARGFALIGFEIKDQRADWLRELKHPEKALEGMAHVDRWFLVAAKGVAKPEEIPETWGFIEQRGDRLFTLKEAPQLQAAPIDRAFCARILSHMGERLRTVERKQRWDFEEKVRKEVREREKQCSNAETKDLKTKLETMERLVVEFEAAAGVSFSSAWRIDAPKIGRLVKAINDGTITWPNLDREEKHLADALDRIHEVQKIINAAASGTNKGDPMNDTEKLAAIQAILTGGPASATTQPVPPMPPPGPDRWKPTDAQKDAFAARIGWSVADLDGDRKDPISPALKTVDDYWLYASFGFGPNGIRNAWVSDDRERYSAICENLKAATTPEAAEAAVKGSSKYDADYVRYLVAQGKYRDGTLYTEGEATTVEQFVQQTFQSYASGQPK